MARWLTRGRQAFVVIAMMAAVAGCVSMPDSGPVGTYGPNQENTAPALQYVGPFVTGPGPNWTPSEIVQGFLDASARYPADPSIAREYLLSSASGKWQPGSVVVYNQLSVPPTAQMSRPGRHGRLQAQVTTTGTVQATFNGDGQYVLAAAQTQGPSDGSYSFKLIQVGGQWRISNPPTYRLLTAADFPQVYQARDLYFVDPADQVLVPDSVFVPAGTSPTDLAKNLVTALSQGPSTPWLQGAADTEFPAKTKVVNVALDGATAVVNLTGAAVAAADRKTLQLISAQLVWTLVGSQASPPPAIQSVELEINGHVPGPFPSPCGIGQAQSGVQKLTSYECFDPYSSGPASFYYANGGLAWSRCGSDRAQEGFIGAVVPVIGRAGALNSHQCGGGLVSAQSTAGPPAQPSSLPAMSMAAVSPDGKYLALVSPKQDAVYIGSLSGGAASFPDTPRLTGAHISALSWRDDYLWVAQGDTIYALPAEGSYKWQVDDSSLPGQVTDFSVAPDGVRIAVIVQTGSGSELMLAAINRPPSSTQVPKGSPVVGFTIGQPVQLGPNLTDPVALTWYDADDLIVLEAAKTGNTLWQVPVDGQQANQLPVTPPGVVWIAADNAANYLVAGLTGGKLDVSAGLDGPWLPLTASGQNPVYPG